MSDQEMDLRDYSYSQPMKVKESSPNLASKKQDSMHDQSWTSAINDFNRLNHETSPGRLSNTNSSNTFNHFQPMQPPKKRTSDGNVKIEQYQHLRGSRPALLPRTQKEYPEIRLHMDTDSLRRRIAAIEAKGQPSDQTARYTAFAAGDDLFRGSPQWGEKGLCKTDSEPIHLSLDEPFLR